MTKVKSLLIVASLMMGLALPVTAQTGEPRQNSSVGFNGGANLNSASLTPKIKQNSLMGITGGPTARYIPERYFAMIRGAQVELNVSQRGWDELFEAPGGNGEPVENSTRKYIRKMTYLDILFLAYLAFGNEKGLQFSTNAGPQIGLLIGESESMENIDMNAPMDTQKAVHGDKIQNKFDHGIAGSGGIEFRTKKAGSFLLEGRYYFALSGFYSTMKEDYFSRAAYGTITVKLTYPFDLKKQEAVSKKTRRESCSNLWFIFP